MDAEKDTMKSWMQQYGWSSCATAVCRIVGFQRLEWLCGGTLLSFRCIALKAPV